MHTTCHEQWPTCGQFPSDRPEAVGHWAAWRGDALFSGRRPLLAAAGRRTSSSQRSHSLPPFNATVCLFVPLRHHLIGASWRSWPAWASFFFLSFLRFPLGYRTQPHPAVLYCGESAHLSLYLFNSHGGGATSPRAGGGVVCSQPTREHFTS